MSDGMTIQWEGQRVLQRFGRLPNAVQTAVVKGSTRGLLLMEDRVRTQTDIKARRGAAGLLGRLTSYARSTGDGMDAAIGFRKTNGFPYELSQEYGAKAAPGKAMSIPLTAKARKAGSPRNMSGLVLIKANNKAFLFSTNAKGEAREPQYILVKSIKPRLRFRENVTKALPMFFRQVILEHDQALGAL